MKLLFKVLIPVLILSGSVLAARAVLNNKPEPRKRPQFPKIQAVEAITLSKGNYPVVIQSQGTVKPTQSSTLVAEVTGTVEELSKNYVVGASFAKGDVLVRIDERDYTIALTQAQANLAQATAALQEEIARGQLAKEEWESMGRGKAASEFTLRVPQLGAARANRDAAQAQVDRAKLDLDRTRFVAPFDGKVLEVSVDQGQFVSRGSPLGQIYADKSVDVRLPLTNKQLTFLSIPSSDNVPQSQLPNIELSAVIAGEEQTWTGKVIRAEGVDAATQQLNVIARIENPFDAEKVPLRIGQYVEAKIAGNVLEQVFVLPRVALREDREVLLINKDSQIERRDVKVAWADEEMVAVRDGLEVGAILVTTALSTVTNGTPVRATIDGKAPPPLESRPEGGQGSKGKWKGEGGAGKGNRGEGGADSQRGDAGKPKLGEANSEQAQPGTVKRGEGQNVQGDRGAEPDEGNPNADASGNTATAADTSKPAKPTTGAIERTGTGASN